MFGFLTARAELIQIPYFRQSQSGCAQEVQSSRLLRHCAAHVGGKSRLNPFCIQWRCSNEKSSLVPSSSLPLLMFRSRSSLTVSLQSSASATGCITFILGPMFIRPEYRTLRALTYLSLGLFAIVFIVHGMYLHGFTLQRRRLSLEWMGLMALLNFLGCSAYAFRIPESRFPGKFDFVGASHQIMHVAVLAAGLVHYHGLSKALLETRGNIRQTC
ncbi:hypothetical protein E4T48_02388 [Aureobasidium sp. EXF-10727]|nr:hypothetical protein E4T48_02388 [Aureobasidium sp. EXF-10727]